MNSRSAAQRGFTLLEVLVALAVMAVALGAIIKATADSANNIGYLRDRTLAGWVALNQINRVLLAPDWPAESASDSGTAEMAGREWQWELTISKTTDKDLRRLEVAVRARDGAAPLATLIAFKGKPVDGNNPQ